MERTLADWCDENNPNLLLEWDYSKNAKKPIEYAPFSNKKVWWRCKQGHEWESVICNRTRVNAGCPYCAGLLPVIGVNDFATLHADLLKEWNYRRNSDVDPSNITPGTGRKVWWICPKGHEWECAVYSRVSGTGCPYCAGNLVIKGETDLATVAPKIAKLWNYERNENLTPSEVKPVRPRRSGGDAQKGTNGNPK